MLRIQRATPADAEALGEMHVRVWRWAYRGLLPDDFLASMRPERRVERWARNLANG